MGRSGVRASLLFLSATSPVAAQSPPIEEQARPDSSVGSDQEPATAEASEPSPAADAVAKGLLDRNLIKQGTLQSEVAELVDQLLDQTRLDQDTVYEATRKINENLDRLLGRKDTLGCGLLVTNLTPNPSVLGRIEVAENTDFPGPEWFEAHPDLLNHPVVIAHPEVLTYKAVQVEPRILDSPVASEDYRLLDSPAVRETPSLLVPAGTTMPSECDEFVRQVRGINSSLLAESYGDSINQNANLSNQIATRLSNIVDDSNDLDTEDKRDRFLEEYTLLANRYLNSRRFRVGFGGIYAYLPHVRYGGQDRIDFSPFLTGPIGGADQLLFDTEFSDTGHLSPLISVKAPYFDIDFAFPDLKVTETTVTPVQPRPTDSATQLLAQSTIESTLDIEFEMGITIAIGKLIERRRERTANRAGLFTREGDQRRRLTRFDWGVGIGMSAFHIDNTVTTDVRFPTDPSDLFNNLPAGNTLTTQDNAGFNTGYLVGYYKFRVSDELEIGVNYRKYESKHADGGQIAIGGDTVSITVAYYPTFHGRNRKKTSN